MKNIFAAAIMILLLSCDAIEQKQPEPVRPSSASKAGAARIDTVALKETFQTEDTATAGYAADSLKAIRENFKRINSIAHWSSVITKELAGSTEGGEAVFYFSGGVLEKIATRQLGETYQQLTEYYLLNGNLSFVFEKTYRYNRPIYYDSTAMKENKDDQAFDLKKSEIIESRNYFEKGKLIHRINSRNEPSITTGYLPEEQRRIVAGYDGLKGLLK